MEAKFRLLQIKETLTRPFNTIIQTKNHLSLTFFERLHTTFNSFHHQESIQKI